MTDYKFTSMEAAEALGISKATFTGRANKLGFKKNLRSTGGQYTLEEIIAVRDIEVVQARQREEKIAWLRKALAKAPAPSQKTIAIVYQQN